MNCNTTVDVLWYMVLTLGEVKGELFMLLLNFAMTLKLLFYVGW